MHRLRAGRTVLLMKLDSEMLALPDSDKAPPLLYTELPTNFERKIVVVPSALTAPPCDIHEPSSD